MIRAFVSLVFLALATLPARAIDIQQITSPGGIKAWLVEDHSIPFTALSLMFKGGASLDAPGQRGATSLMTALLEEGSGPMNSVQYAEAVETLGAQARFEQQARPRMKRYASISLQALGLPAMRLSS